VTYQFRMPDIGEGIAEVEIVDWLVAVGDSVAQDQPLVTVETDKARVDIPTPVAGTVSALGAQPAEFVPVGAVLFELNEAGSAPGAGPAAPRAEPTAPGAPTEVAAAVGAPEVEISPTAPAAQTGGRARVKAAPSVRRLADERGIELAAVRGTGPDGRVTKDDVFAAQTAQTGAPPAAAEPSPGPPAPPAAPPTSAPPQRPFDEVIPLRGLRRTIAKNMSQAWRTIPHIIDWRQADASALIAVRSALRVAYPDVAQHVTYVPLLVKIVASALQANPLMNASLTPEEDGYVLHSSVNIGIATSTPDGLLVPVVRDADRKSVIELGVEIAELVGVTRTRSASTEQLTGGTYTVNNVGALGGTMGTPIIRSPEVGILGFGRVVSTVVAQEGQAVVRPVMTLSSVGDHRLHDGAELSAFTAHVVDLIENPLRLLGALR